MSITLSDPKDPMTVPANDDTADRALYSVREFCRRNSIGKTTFYDLVKAGAVETIKVGSHTLVPASSERAWHAALIRKPAIPPTRKSTYKRPADLGERQRSATGAAHSRSGSGD